MWERGDSRVETGCWSLCISDQCRSLKRAQLPSEGIWINCRLHSFLSHRVQVLFDFYLLHPRHRVISSKGTLGPSSSLAAAAPSDTLEEEEGGQGLPCAVHKIACTPVVFAPVWLKSASCSETSTGTIDEVDDEVIVLVSSSSSSSSERRLQTSPVLSLPALLLSARCLLPLLSPPLLSPASFRRSAARTWLQKHKDHM